MIWKKCTIHTTEEAEDILSMNLAELGIEGVQIEDRMPLTVEDTKGMFVDQMPDFGPDDGTADVSFYVEILHPEEKQDRLAKAAKVASDPSIDASYTPNTANVYTRQEFEELLQKVRAMLQDTARYCDIGAGTMDFSDTEDKDWINNWKTYFHPFHVDDILVKPIWEKKPVDDTSKLVIEIDPGTAFGTGMHDTTQLCIRQLKKYINPNLKTIDESTASGAEAEAMDAHAGINVADIGTGSGILGVTALMLGASHVFGTDLDEESIPSIKNNLKANHLTEDRFDIAIDNIVGNDALKARMGLGAYDIVVANILAPVIELLTGEVAPLLKLHGLFITSGIIDEKEKEVLQAFHAHEDLWDILGVNHQGEWINITAKKK